MFRLHKITLTQFKNYSLSSFGFDQRVTGICGLNGRGKTNLLDAIYYCCFTRSYFTRNDGSTIQFDKEGFRLEALFEEEGREQKLICILRGGKKELTLNDVPYEKLSTHIGRFPVVIIAPDDIELITGTSEERRKFIDTVLSQMNEEYLQQLILYNKILLQRNSLLKRFAEQGKTDIPLLEVLDGQLIGPGNFIFRQRTEFLGKLIPLVQQFYAQIANNGEAVSLEYETRLRERSFAELLLQVREKDLVLQRSNAGVHKDEINMLLNGQSFRTTASQGQRKSLLFALKLAEFELLRKNKGFAPLLLMDDIFEKLDDPRMQQLLNWVCNENTGQVLITDTHRERLETTFRNLKVEHRVIEL